MDRVVHRLGPANGDDQEKSSPTTPTAPSPNGSHNETAEHLIERVCGFSDRRHLDGDGGVHNVLSGIRDTFVARRPSDSSPWRPDEPTAK